MASPVPWVSSVDTVIPVSCAFASILSVAKTVPGKTLSSIITHINSDIMRFVKERFILSLLFLYFIYHLRVLYTIYYVFGNRNRPVRHFSYVIRIRML